MKHSFSRVIAASVGALALAGMTAGVAQATDSVTPDPYYAGSIYLVDGVSLGAAAQPLAYDAGVNAIPAVGDIVNKFPIPAGATEAWGFIAPQGMENQVSKWNAKSVVALTPGGVWLPDMTPQNQITQGLGSPAGTNAVKAAGGAYSIGLAYTTNSGVTLISEYYGHVQITAGTGEYTFTDTAVAKTATTTTLTVPATTPAENAAFNLSAAVSPAAATGSVQFFDGTTSLGTSAVSAGTATLNVAAGLAGGTHSITAQYLGDSSHAASTSAAASMVIAGTPVTTTLAVTATSASGFGGSAVVYTATVTPASATGSVAFSALKAGDTVPVALGSFPVSAGVATTTLSGLGAGSWTVTGAFTGTGVFQNSTNTASLSLVVDPNSNAATPDPQTVTVVVPKGALTITTPWTAANPLALGTLQLNQATSTFELAAPVNFASSTDITKGIKIINSRPDQPHFTAQVASTDFTSTGGSFVAGKASLVNVAAHALTGGNALLPSDVVPANVTALANTAQTFATYAASNLGTAWLSADFNIKGVPSSTPSGTYTATVTFTAF